MIPMSKRPAGYLLSIEDLTEALFWAKSLSGQSRKAQVGFQYLLQFKLAVWENEIFTFLPAFYDWFPSLGDVMYSVDIQSECVWFEWLGE